MAPTKDRASLSRQRADLERYEAQLAEWTALIGQYRAEARRAEPHARVELDTLMDELQLLRNEACAQVGRLKCAGEESWEHERALLERSWQAVRHRFQRALDCT